MPAIILSLILTLGAAALLVTAVILNQIEPTIATAMTVPFANLAGFILAFIGMAIAIVVYNMRRESALAKWTMLIGIVCAALLMILLPLSDKGYLSKFH